MILPIWKSPWRQVLGEGRLSSIGHRLKKKSTGLGPVLDYKNGAIGLELNIYDKNMRHKTDGMVKLRNSDVLDKD